MATATYLIALGSNRRSRHGPPASTLRAAATRLPGRVTALSPVISSAPLGPSHRRYANAAALVESELAPPAMLSALKAIERDFGRRRGRRWGARVLDLDIVLWSGGRWQERALTIPHAAFRDRAFVLCPAAAIARGWRDPVTGLTLAQLRARLTGARAIPRSRPRW
ncbi:2-amino-4-hydroxy-6-hydroxymethyldihydropteridine diphosphokinase [Sphingomonas spermidinifaciens]|uniref:2-amino-4-hydroxy-6-hydroxymethyldihydropteridine pyrophosphokinase n=1 Tax=Sphingomonas spermidinifaciens TaxID=1141889 RepID=A0A2A4B3P2_9SPHN|nr:2-amino-4-hydroxy-6-hydroxymethyldihydropteridine diphosphokinase [Sphingomonas spermidinifaciens]PCD02266.1 2-amino-4-hydroxy-6-hydroxymethyldihydropteridine diphosphokinase [Sphingomonas spermidinifaciens]